MSVCATVYVVLGERPDLDRLALCSRDRARLGTGLAEHCTEHLTQRGWVDADPGRRALYAIQVAQFERQDTVEVVQGALL